MCIPHWNGNNYNVNLKSNYFYFYQIDVFAVSPMGHYSVSVIFEVHMYVPTYIDLEERIFLNFLGKNKLITKVAFTSFRA